MIRIDPRTVNLLAGVMSAFMALILFSLRRHYPSTIKGLGEWLFLVYVGIQRFFDIKPRFAPWIALIIGVVAVQVWFTFVQPSFPIRLALSNALAACLFFAMARMLYNQGVSTFARALTIGVLVTMLGILVMRLVTLTVLPAGNDVLDTSPQPVIYVTSFAFLIVLLSVSLVLMAAERLHTEMAYLASHDSLTNALTRRNLNEVCSIELARSQRHGHSLAMLIMDLDHFKAINDTHGHQRGDRVLVDFVAKVNTLLRRPDQLARFGGEEFVALLPETSLEEALCVAERIRAAWEACSQGPACTVSIGVTTNRMANDTVDTLISRADAAMYQAKTKGRSRVESA